MTKRDVAQERDALHTLVNMELHSAYNPRRIDVSQEPGGPSMTRQDMADECDINNIMARYKTTGLVPVNGEPRYLDMTMAPDNLMDAMNQIIHAEEAFMTLPASVRKEFDNDAVRFVEFAADSNNLEQLREWGLAPPPVPEELPPLGSAERPISIVPARPDDPPKT